MSDETRFRTAYDVLMERMPDPPAFDHIISLEPRRRTPIATLPRWVPMTGVTLLAALSVGAVLVFDNPASDSPQDQGAGNPATPPLIEDVPNVGDGVGFEAGLLFGKELPWTLLFDDGYDKVKAIDVNVGIPYVSEIPGAGAGDPPFRLIEEEGHLIVGFGAIYSHSVTTRESTHIGNATIYLPAAEDGRVWLVDYEGRIGANPPEVWQVAVEGEVLTDRSTIGVEGLPSMGIPGGLAVETEEGIALWDHGSGSILGLLGSDASSRVADVSLLGQIAWCQDRCDQMEVSWAESGDSFSFSHPDVGIGFIPGAARFSTDGRYLAAPTRSDLVVIDVTTGEVELIDLAGRMFDYVNWAPSGPDLFASTYSYGLRSMTIAHVNAETGEAEVADLPYGGALGFVVVPTDGADTFLNFDCPVTTPTRSGFIAPEPWPGHYPLDDDQLWYGTEGLWTLLPADPSEYGPRRSVWWSASFPGGETGEKPDISVFWQRLDADAPAVYQFGGTNALTDEGWFMIAGADPETPGCWQVTATYKGATLTYVYDNR